jgi:NTE family protein
VLEQAGIGVDCIAGTSAGSLIGAAYAAGLRSERLLALGSTIRWRHIAEVVWPQGGFVSFARIEDYLEELPSTLTFDELEIPFAAVAADLATGEQVILKEGRVLRAVQASCAIPGIVVPVEWDGRLLSDGGVVNNLPISVVRELGADVVIAVDLIGPFGRQPKGWRQVMMAAGLALLARAADDPATADITIHVPIQGLGSLMRLSAAPALIALGRQAAEEALPAIEARLTA